MRSRLFEDELVLAFRDGHWENYFIDIGAGDGSTWSNSLLLAEHGWSGVCFECFQPKFAHLSLLHAGRPNISCIEVKVTVENIRHWLKELNVPTNPCLLSVDIDGMDAYIIEEILRDYVYVPQIIIAEYNHMIPPPVRFCVNYDPTWTWGVNSFFGASIDHLDDIIGRHGYSLTNAMCGNAIWRRDSYSNVGTTEQLWRAEHIPFCRLTGEADSFTLGSALTVDMAPEAKIRYVDEMFAQFAGQYKVSLYALQT